ncbi:MAG TPA: FtsQ-type POTRA domain-containing protein [Candidatus Dormibacteraeota bacterium]|nr:FtsQ-type POTRA domain-containing protein [Candidatus Dormibacteraeota bacterium]
MPQHLTERPFRASPPLDDVAARHAQIRAIAAGLVDGPRMGRRFHVPAGVPLEASPRRRRHGPRRTAPPAARDRAPTARRLVGAAVLLMQVGLLAALLMSPAFKVHTVDVSGDRLLSRDAVLAAARVPQASLFTIDGDAIRARISALPWVRSATISTQLPSTVHIEVTEWQPDVLLRHGSDSTFVAANGATLAYTQATAAARRGTPLLLDYRPGVQQPLLPGFGDLLAGAAQRWQATFGCTLDAFVISNSNILSAWCGSGWQAVFGALDSSDAVAAIPVQLAVLAALRGRINLASPNFGYVDLENVSSPAVGGTPGRPGWLVNDIAGSALPAIAPPQAAAVTPAPATPASPTPAPTPTPRPTPTPLVFNLAPPSPRS